MIDTAIKLNYWPTLALDDCQNISKVIDHANICHRSKSIYQTSLNASLSLPLARKKVLQSMLEHAKSEAG